MNFQYPNIKYSTNFTDLKRVFCIREHVLLLVILGFLALHNQIVYPVVLLIMHTKREIF